MIKKYTQTGFVFALILFIVAQMAAQNPMQDSLQKQFRTYQENSLQEKIYLHTDKDVYLTGEIGWFKIYAVDAFFNKPLDVSKVVYVEVLDKNNKAVWQTKIALNKGFGNGSLSLPWAINSGKYKLRAYTNWMKNASTDYFFEKTITIINTKEVYETDSLPQEAKYFVRFFPEGGNLVNGIQSTIAFHVTDKNGNGVLCNGLITNGKNDTITQFLPLKFGMGRFTLTPKTNETYKAIVTLSNGEKIIAVLPKVFTEGYVMHLAEVGNQIKISVQTNVATPPSVIYLFAHTRGVVKTAITRPCLNGLATFLIDKNKMGDGISHFTVFNADRQAVCERLYFQYPKQRLALDMVLDEQSFGLRKKINIHITTKNQDEKPTAANLSMAVYKIDALQNVPDMDIENYLWLSSDLIGNVESAGYYLKNKGIGTEEAADNLMLTQGWRRFKWADILDNKKPAFEFKPEYTGHIVTGKITNGATKLPAPNIESFLSVPSTHTLFHRAKSDKDGSLAFDLKDFYNEGKIIVQAQNTRDSTYDVAINNPFSVKFTQKPVSTFLLSAINTTDLTPHYTATQVQNRYWKSSEQFTMPNIDTTAFYLKPDQSYLLDNYVRFTNLEEVLREYVTPVSVQNRSGQFRLTVWNTLRNRFFDTDPLVLLDGMPIFDLNKLMNYDPLKIKQLDIVSRQYYLGKSPVQGIVNFTTYGGNMPDYELDAKTVLDYEGLQQQREFAAPAYETAQQIEARLPDFRHLLYWSPDIQTSETGKKEIHFYSSDLSGRFAVVLQGLTNDGKTGCQVVVFDVKKP